MLLTNVTKKNLPIAATNFFFWAAVYVFLLVLPILYAHMHLKSSLIGIVVGSYSVGAILFRFLAGLMADKFGYGKIALYGIIIAFVSICFSVFYKSWIIVSIARFFYGIGSALYSSTALAIITLSNEEQDIKEAVALYTLCSMLGIGAVTGVANILYNKLGFNTIILFAIISTLFALYCFSRKYIEYANLPLQKSKTQVKIKQIIVNSNIYIPTINQFSVYFCYGIIMTFLPIVSISHGLNKWLWMFYVPYALVVILSRFMVRYITKIFSSEVLSLIILVGLSLTMLMLIVPNSKGILLIIGILFGLVVGLAMPIFVSLVASKTAPSMRGGAMGFFSSSLDLGVAAGSIFIGMLTIYLSYTDIFILVSILTLFNTSFYSYRLFRKNTALEL